MGTSAFGDRWVQATERMEAMSVFILARTHARVCAAAGRLTASANVAMSGVTPLLSAVSTMAPMAISSAAHGMWPPEHA
jgi:hypothetical protein